MKKLKEKYDKNIDKYSEEAKKHKYIELTYFYSIPVLAQLIFLRYEIGYNWKNTTKYNNAILAIALGLMHGPARKNNITSFFSIDMPNTISYSPNYVKNYAIKHNLKLPIINIFDRILLRINKIWNNEIDKPFFGKIYFSNALKNNINIKNNSINLVITSPPYVNLVNYTSSNWLKLWLLGFDRENLKDKIKLSDKLSIDKYPEFIKSYLNIIYDKLKNNAVVCLVVGDVYEKTLIEDVWLKIKNDLKYNFVGIYYDEKYMQTHKITNMLNSKKGKATVVEKVLVLRKI